MEFLYITSLGMTYRYVVKIKKKFKKKRQKCISANSSQLKYEIGVPNPHSKGQRKDIHSWDNQSMMQHKNGNEKMKDTGKWCEYQKIPWKNTEECRSKQSLMVELKAFESEVDSDSESNPIGGKRIIYVESSAKGNTSFTHRNQRKGNASFTHRCG
jgi:hypothetical protein